MAQLIRVIYYSRNCIVGSPAAVSDAIQNILRVSRQANAACGLTGALMFNRSSFAQVLEGGDAAVEATYRRIAADRRHSDIQLLAKGNAPSRWFPHWSMAYIGRSESDGARYGDIAGSTGFDTSGMTGDALLQTLLGLVADMERN